MRRIAAAFDLGITVHAVGGVARYARGLCTAAARAAVSAGMDFVTVDVPASHPGISIEADTVLDDPWFLRLPFFRRMPLSLGWEPALRPRRLGRLIECDVFHCSGVQPCHPRGSLPVVTMHDLTAYENPEWHTRATIEYAERERILVEKRGAAVVTGSQWAAGMAESFFGLEGRERVWAIGGAADDLFCPGKPDRSVLARYGLEAGRFLLMVGNLEPRKNIGFALAVHEKAIGMGLGMPVALVGKAGWRLGTASLSSSRNVRLLRNVPDRQLLELYRGCRAVLLPSLCEGLGLVALEAMACGAPLISSNSGALPETVGRGGLLLDPGDASGWVSCLMSLRDDAFARDLRLRALGMPRRGWSRVGERLCAVYGKLAR